MEGSNDYRMSFSTGGLFLNESVEFASLHREDEAWEETQARAVKEGTTQLPKDASNTRSIREIKNRVSTLTAEELDFFVREADRADQKALLWLACCRAYRFVREFAVDVLQDRYLSYQLDLPLEAFDIFFDAKAEWHDELAELSTSTRLKLRQILFRMMREADILSEQKEIQTYLLSSKLIAMIQSNTPEELNYFPGQTWEGS